MLESQRGQSTGLRFDHSLAFLNVTVHWASDMTQKSDDHEHFVFTPFWERTIEGQSCQDILHKISASGDLDDLLHRYITTLRSACTFINNATQHIYLGIVPLCTILLSLLQIPHFTSKQQNRKLTTENAMDIKLPARELNLRLRNKNSSTHFGKPI